MVETDFFSEVETDEPVTISALLAVPEIPIETGTSGESDKMDEHDRSSEIQHLQSGSTGNDGQLRVVKVETATGTLVDPETGEVLERPYLMQRLGWTEAPNLPDAPTLEELRTFEGKLDQLVDIICTYEDRINRYTAEFDYRIAKIAGVKEYFESFAAPLAKQLGDKTLKRYRQGEKKGQFAKKSLHLPSGTISFRVKGGWEVDDFEAVKEYVRELPEEDFQKFHAEKTIKIDYPKFKSALNKGAYEKVPGTKFTTPDPLGSVSIKSPKIKGIENDGDDTD